MANIEVNGQTVELDEDGFLVKLDQWNEDVARYLAKEEGVDELNEDHWKIINYLKGYFGIRYRSNGCLLYTSANPCTNITKSLQCKYSN